MKRRQKLLTDEQWELIEPLFPKPKPRSGQQGTTARSESTLF
jgi:transposase